MSVIGRTKEQPSGHEAIQCFIYSLAKGTASTAARLKRQTN